MRTYFQDFNRDDGSPVTVEYSFSAGSPTTYSPRFGADGGDPCEVTIIKSWPNTAEYNTMVNDRNALMDGHVPHVAPVSLRAQEKAAELDVKIKAAREAATLTDAERERMEAWISEHHVDEPDDDYEF